MHQQTPHKQTTTVVRTVFTGSKTSTQAISLPSTLDDTPGLELVDASFGGKLLKTNATGTDFKISGHFIMNEGNTQQAYYKDGSAPSSVTDGTLLSGGSPQWSGKTATQSWTKQTGDIGTNRYYWIASSMNITYSSGSWVQVKYSFDTNTETSTTTRKPNIVFVYVDDMGWTDYNIDGSPSSYYYTPNIEEFSKKGAHFPNAYAWRNCAPSRGALMSGTYPDKNGVKNNNDHLDTSLYTIANYLQNNTYYTASFGKWHIGNKDTPGTMPQERGFDVNFGGYKKGAPAANSAVQCKYWAEAVYTPCSYGTYFSNPDGSFPSIMQNLGATAEGKQEFLTDRIMREAIKWIGQKVDADHTRPFFAYIPHYGIHTPIMAPQSDIDFFNNRTKTAYHSVPEYAALLKRVDDNFGKMITYLETTPQNPSKPNGEKLIDNTLVIFYSDNGGLNMHKGLALSSQHPLRAGKRSWYEGGIRVPLFMRWDNKIGAGTTNNQLVSAVDFMPTLLDITGITLTSSQKNPYQDGEVLNLKGEVCQDRSIILNDYFSKNNGKKMTIIRGDWKLIYNYKSKRYEMYNIHTDIGESTNVANTAANSGIRYALVKEIKAYLDSRFTGDNEISSRVMNVTVPSYVNQKKGECALQNSHRCVNKNTDDIALAQGKDGFFCVGDGITDSVTSVTITAPNASGKTVYVQKGALPTLTTYACKGTGNCTITNPTAGTYFVSVMNNTTTNPAVQTLSTKVLVELND